MKKFKAIFNYVIWIPFAVAIGAFALYFRYLFAIKFAPNVSITGAINATMDRYLKVGLFALFFGLLLLVINKVSKIIFNEDKYYNEKYPWTKIKKEEEIENKTEEKEIIKEEVKEEKDYIINNKTDDSKISTDLKTGKILKARFIDDKEEKKIEILTDDEEETEVLSLDNVVVMPEVKNQTIIKVDSSKVRIDGFKHCPKCNNLVVEDAVICVHCGVLLKDVKSGNNSLKEEYKKPMFENKKINSVKLAINAIIIIVALIGIILLCHMIGTKKAVNDSNINQTNTVNKSVIK